jgi:hypothetical protein
MKISNGNLSNSKVAHQIVLYVKKKIIIAPISNIIFICLHENDRIVRDLSNVKHINNKPRRVKSIIIGIITIA